MSFIGDVFSGDAFSSRKVTQLVNKIAYRPHQAMDLLLPEVVPIATPNYAVDVDDDANQVFSVGTRRNIGKTNTAAKSVPFTAHRIEVTDRVSAEEVMGRRRPGTEDLETAEQVLVEKLARINANMCQTHEMHLLGAIKGVVKDADNTNLDDLFTKFDVLQSTESIDLAGSAPKLLNFFEVSVSKKIEDALGGVPYTDVIVLCGDQFYGLLKEALIGIDGADRHYIRDLDISGFTADTKYTGFTFAGFHFIRYRNGATTPQQIGTTKAYAIPRGVPGMFKLHNAPIYTVDGVNAEPSMLMEARTEIDDFGQAIGIFVGSTIGVVNTRPNAVVELTDS